MSSVLLTLWLSQAHVFGATGVARVPDSERDLLEVAEQCGAFRIDCDRLS